MNECKHYSIDINSQLPMNKHRKDFVCLVRAALASRHYQSLNGCLYNKLNKIYNLYQGTSVDTGINTGM